jgi:RHS repeat-associated protein
MTNDGQNTLVYDGENRAVSATVTGSSSGTYTYDGKGLRIQKVSVVSGTTTTTVYVFSGGKVIAEYDNGASPSLPTREYILAGGKLLAKIDTSGTKYYHQDHLSNRMVTDSSGNTVTQMGHFPFGESWYNVTKDKLTFTTYERDAESGNDYAQARYYISRLARFSSPDPIGGNPSNPQSWNRYSYVLNDPINLNDPEGKYCQYLANDGFGIESVDYNSTQDECDSTGGVWVPDPPEAPDLGNPNFGPAPDLGQNGQPAAPPGYQDCITAALEQVLATGEGTANAQDGGYGLLVYGTIMSAHGNNIQYIGQTYTPNNPFLIDNPQDIVGGNPQIYVGVHPNDPPRTWTSAFGRYQITYSTAQAFGFTDFSPAGQDAAAATMLNYYDAVQPAMQGDFQQAVWNMWAWQSMPDSSLGGNQISMQTATAVFQDALNTLPECQ